MKSLIASMTALISITAFAQTKELKQVYKLDTTATQVEWVGKKLAGEHRGMVPVKSGELVVLGELLTGGSVVVDLTKLNVTDIKEKEYNDKLVGHLHSGDFFDTAKHPEAKLVIKDSKKVGANLEVQGDLTMKGKTHLVKFLTTEFKVDGKTLTAKANVTVDRTKYGIKYNSGSFFKDLGDKVINDEFVLNIEVVAKK